MYIGFIYKVLLGQLCERNGNFFLEMCLLAGFMFGRQFFFPQ